MEPFVTERPRLRRALWLLASGGLAVGVYLLWAESSGLRANPDTIDSAQKRVELARSAELASDQAELERQLRRALELEPGVELLTEIGHLYARAELWKESAATYEEALALAPDDTSLLEWTTLANRQLDRPERMRELLERQLALQPDDVVSHLRIASVAKRLGDEKAAIRHKREVIRLGSGEPALRNDVAWTLATSRDEQIRDPAEAIRLAEALVDEAQTRDPNEIDTLAAAYAAAGRFEDAVRTASQAASLAAERGQTELAETIRSRVEIYRSQRPYVDTESSNGA
jgi:spermidine synthase